MQYVLFGNTGMKTSRFCLGAMTFGSHLDTAAAQRVVDEALDRGVNFIDTADSYGDSQEILGRILPEKRERVYLATKVYRRFCRDGNVARNGRTNILFAVERSLRLMRTDYIDLYQLHHPDNETPAEVTLSTLDTLVRQGKVRYVGVSNHYAWQMAAMIGLSKAHQWEPLVSLQANYNILERQIEAECVPFLRTFNVALMCYGPLCGGILTGKYHTGQGIPADSRVDKQKSLERLAEPDLAPIIGALREIAAEQQLQMNQLTVLWLMAKPHATAILLGGTKPEHFRELLDIADRQLPPDVVARIDALSAARVHRPYQNQPFPNAPLLGAQW